MGAPPGVNEMAPPGSSPIAATWTISPPGRAAAGGCASADAHKVTKSFWGGLFACYQSPDLPRTNNDLEHAFGSHRYHERRSSGRRRAAPGLVVSGSARLIAGLATRLRPEEGLRLRDGSVAD